MKFFAYDENIDEQVRIILRRIRKLMNGEVASQLQRSGMEYEKLFGVSLVHLRQISQDYKPDNVLAERLWYRGVRETMILATIIADKERLSDDKLMEWAPAINNLELAEQMAFNLLGKRTGSAALIEKWVLHSQFYVRYAALMALGWQFRFVGEEVVGLMEDNLSTLEALADDNKLSRAVVHCLKMAGRFSESLRPGISALAERWKEGKEAHLRAAGEEILFELEVSDN